MMEEALITFPQGSLFQLNPYLNLSYKRGQNGKCTSPDGLQSDGQDPQVAGCLFATSCSVACTDVLINRPV